MLWKHGTDSYLGLTFLFLFHKMTLNDTGEMAQLVKYWRCKYEYLNSVFSNDMEKPGLKAHACHPSAGEAEIEEFVWGSMTS